MSNFRAAPHARARTHTRTTTYGDVTVIGHVNQTLNRLLPPNSITLLNESTTLSVVNPFHVPNDYHTYDLTIELADATGRGHTLTSVDGTISMRIGNLHQTIHYAQGR